MESFAGYFIHFYKFHHFHSSSGRYLIRPTLVVAGVFADPLAISQSAAYPSPPPARHALPNLGLPKALISA